MKNLLLALAFLGVSANAAQAGEWIDRSSAIFFPSELKSQIGASQNFPVFWWNFFVITALPKNTPDWARAQATCEKLKSISKSELTQVQCETTPEDFLPIIRPWARDLIFREDMPKVSDLQKNMLESLAEVSLPTGGSGLIDVLRNDPFETWRDLKAHAEKRMPLHLELKNKFLWDEKTGRILIPVQFAFPPNEGFRTKAVLGEIEHPILIGPHGSTFQNESQIRSDLRRVTWAGIFVLCIFSLVLYRLRMVKLVPLFLGVVVGTAASAVITKLFFGSIHGLTLSFGAAIAGLAMDYAFQAALNFRAREIWKSNFCGFCTTTVGLVVVMFSSIPLLRQMMFFALVAMAISFSLFYLFFKYSKYAACFSVESTRYSPRLRKFQAPVSAVLVFIAFAGLFFVRPVLDLRQFDFQTSEQKEISRWLYDTTQIRTPIFQVHPRSEISALDTEKNWADLHHVNLENRATYLPSDPIALRHQNTWVSGRSKLLTSLTSTERKFFTPYFQEQAKLNEVPVYAMHLTSPAHPGDEWISLWLPANEAEASKIQKSFPATESLSAVVSIFPKMLSRELGMMVPISILLALMFHLIYYRRLSYATIALLPFFTGLGLIVLASLVFHFSFSFISVIALILVFGFSLDYGIFATDACIREHELGMWTGITLAACSTVAGFIPLVFCKHPVLKDLGLTLFLGGIGTYLGAIWGVPHAVLAVKNRGTR
jgi:hypothetical protein